MRLPLVIFFRAAFRTVPLSGFAVGAMLLSACSVGPDYVRPDTLTPSEYKERAMDVAESEWRPAAPGELDPNPWWRTFDDPVLNDLMGKVEGANQDIQAALANLRLARAQVREARASFFPTIGASGSGSRGQSTPGGGVHTNYKAQLQGSWELDLWGGTRRSVESSDATAQATAADLGNVILSMRGELAQNYFQLRALDEQLGLYKETVAAFERSLAITQNQYSAGTVTKVDVAQAQAQLKAAQAQAVDLELQRRQTEHAIASLMGTAPSQFSLKSAPLSAYLPRIAPVLPASLLERRPDIAGAERRVAAANAKIGVAKSAYYPTLSLGASGGYQSSMLDKLFMAPNQIWSLGPSLALSLFQGGALLARTDQAVASWDRTVAQYRQTVLGAFQEVEDQLAAVDLLEQESVVQQEALAASREAERLFLSQYSAGTVTYLSVVSAQTTALNNARTAVSIKGRRFLAAVALIRALGGGWDYSGMQTEDGTIQPAPQTAP